LNSVYAADTYEPGTARTRQRLHAARELQDAGYRLTLRIDPMDSLSGLEKGLSRPGRYDLWRLRSEAESGVGLLAAFRRPDLIDTGRERFPNSDLFCYDFPKEDRAKYRLPFTLRMDMLRTVIDRIRKHAPRQNVGVCKENIKTWQVLG
jgi:hypothetical protein